MLITQGFDTDSNSDNSFYNFFILVSFLYFIYLYEDS